MPHRNFLALVLLLSSVCVAAAAPANGTAPATAAGAPPAATALVPSPPPPPKPPKISRLDYACLHPNASPTVISGTSQLTAALSSETVWQPQDGHVKFTITYPNNGSPSPLSALEIRVCFGWPAMVSQSADPATAPTVYAATYVQVLSRDDHSVTYETSMPPGLWQDHNATGFGDIWIDLWNRWTGAPRHIYDGWGVVPILNMHVVGRNGGDANAAANIGPNAINVVLPVGLTWRWMALFITVALTGIAWSCLLRWARHRKVRGGWVIRIISNRNNYASLSQFQIMLWTLVIAAGAVYVMTLTGSLISIPGQALALLGISGFSALSAAVKAQQDAAKPQAAADDGQAKPTNPSAVRDLRVLGANSATTVVIWRKGKGGTPTVRYDITLKDSAGAAVAFAVPPPGNTFFAVPTPAAGAFYDLAVTAVDAVNNRSAVAGLRIEPSAAPVDAAPTVQSLSASLPAGDNAPVVSWAALTPADFYLLQYRRAGSPDWELADTPLAGGAAGARFLQAVPELQFQMPYEFQIIGVKGGQLGAPSSVATITTGERMPRWSDLVVWDGQHELDITRVQMLVFTVLAAIFVVLKIGDDSAIPQIPDSVILLMGLSNGVYVGGKFVGATR